MKKPLPLLAALCLGGILASGTANAATINQLQSFSSLSTNSLVLTWNQFDSALGTLTGISLIIDGTVTGSFDVFNSDLVDPATLSNPKDRLRLTFSGLGAPSAQQTAQTTLTTIPAMQFTIATNSNQSFNLGLNPQSLGSVNNNLFAFAEFFTGTGTLSSTLVQPFVLTSDNSGNTTVDYSQMFASGSVSIDYTYDAIPEPSTYALMGLGALALVVAYRRKRSA
ncbi:MAG: PEP-CTERM sorting domain-containing protein [Verrucomicrobia bacterium]|nr:PEP-CTERM sorting domain-containing protein [Verrucomicrobiota bacterium]